MDQRGVVYCGGHFSQIFCIAKLIQTLISTTVLSFTIYDLINRYRIEKQFNFFFILFVLMTLTLISNITYCLFYTVHQFGYLEVFFFYIYFSVLVYHVALKILSIKKIKHQQLFIRFTHGIFAGYVLSLTAIFVSELITNYRNCTEVWYIVIDGMGVTLSAVLIIFGIMHTKKQKQKLRNHRNPQYYKNPIFSIWIWIIVNTFSQFSTFLETLIFTISGKCSFSTNSTINILVKLLFSIMGFHIGMIATITFFRKKYQDQQVYKDDISVQDRLKSANVELIFKENEFQFQEG